MTKIETLKKQLLDLGVTQEEVDTLQTKEEVKNWIDRLNTIDEIADSNSKNFDAISIKPGENKLTDSDKINEENVVVGEIVPDYNSDEWESYVMSKFAKEELANDKYPKLAGLRRLVLLLGEIVESRPINAKTEYPDGTGAVGRATTEYIIRIAWTVGLSPATLSMMNVKDFPIVTFGACGGSSYLNTDEFVQKYPEAIAESRAEARALRKALRLSTVSADEITRNDMKAPSNPETERCVSPETDVPTKITTAQIKVIQNMCGRLKIDVLKYINSGKAQYANIEDVPYEKALLMLRVLNSYQSNGDETKPIPEEIKLKS